MQDAVKTAAFFALATIVNFAIVRFSQDTNNVAELYILSVLMVSLGTSGYFWGLLSALFGVVGANCFFTYPYFVIDFTLEDYPLMFLSMLTVAIITSTMAAGVKEQTRIAREHEKKTKQLNETAQRLLCISEDTAFGQLAAESLHAFTGVPAAFFMEAEEHGFWQCGKLPCDMAAEQEIQLARECISSNMPTGWGAGNSESGLFRWIPLESGRVAQAAVGFCRTSPEELPEETRDALPPFLSQLLMTIDRLRLEEERRVAQLEKQTEQMRGNLLRAISHDLRTPLTGILGASSAILENGERIDPESHVRLITDIHEDAEWLLRMVENVLSVTRIGSGGPSLKKTSEAVEEVVAQATNKCKKRFPEVRLLVQAPDEFLMAPMDATLIEQVIINLVENAVRHGGKQNEIEVRFARGEKQAVFTVRDHGCGIEPTALPLLFEGFSTRKREDSDSSRGLGIGLSLCRSIVVAHGGEIEGHNMEDGGACFTFTLPLEEDSDGE